MSEELAALFKNIMQRGYSLEQIKNSFINAGYERQEVEEAASLILGNTSENISGAISESISGNQFQPKALQSSQLEIPKFQDSSIQKSQFPQQAQQFQFPQQTQQTQIPQKKSGILGKILVFLIIILILVLSAFVYYNWQEIVNFFNSS